MSDGTTSDDHSEDRAAVEGSEMENPDRLQSVSETPSGGARRDRLVAWWRQLGGGPQVVVGVIVLIATAVVGALAQELVPRLVDRFDGQPDPFIVVVQRNPDHITTDHGHVGGSYLFDLPLQEIGAPPEDEDSCVGRYEWAREKGGVDADATTVRVTVEATNAELIHVEHLDVEIVDASPPPPGTHITCPGRGATPEIRTVSILLDDEHGPEVETTDDDGNSIPFLFQVGKGEAEVLDVTALAPECDCTWRATLHIRVEGEVYEFTLDDDGRPFRTVSSLGARSYRWIDGEWFDEDIATPTPSATSPPTIDNTIACNIVSQREIDQLLGMPSTVTPEYNDAGPGASGIETQSSACSYVGESGEGGLHTSLTVDVTTADTEERAEQELQTRVDLMSEGAARTPVEHLGDEAFRIRGGLIARRASEILAIYVVTADGRDRTGAVERLLRAVAARRWS